MNRAQIIAAVRAELHAAEETFRRLKLRLMERDSKITPPAALRAVAGCELRIQILENALLAHEAAMA